MRLRKVSGKTFKTVSALYLFTDSEAHLLTNQNGGDMEDSKPSKSTASENLMFEDGVRRIDIIVAYEANAAHDPHRQKYFDNLKVLGLEFEQAKQVSGLSF